MKPKALREQFKLALFAHNHDRACLVPAIIWLARAVKVVRPCHPCDSTLTALAAPGAGL